MAPKRLLGQYPMGLPANAGIVLDAILYSGELPRGHLPGLLDTSAQLRAQLPDTRLHSAL
jgi:hypothetical protein